MDSSMQDDSEVSLLPFQHGTNELHTLPPVRSIQWSEMGAYMLLSSKTQTRMTLAMVVSSASRIVARSL